MPKSLVVDDVEVSRFSTQQFLSELGIEAVTVTNIHEAREALEKSPRYDVIFVDWHIGQNSGLDLMKEMRSKYMVTCPIIVVSGVEGADAGSTALTAGASAFVVKPTTKDKLQNSLKKVGVL